MPRTKRAKPEAERDVLKGVMDACRTLGIPIQRQNTGMATNPKGGKVRFGTPGNADLSGTLPDGRRLEIEVKRPGKKPTDAQWHRIHEVNASNGCAFWVDNPADAFRVLSRLLEGWRVEIDEAGNQFVTDDDRGT